MPELPEVETLRHDLEERLLDRVIRSTKVWETRLRKPLPKARMGTLVDRRLSSVNRRAKYLLLALDDGRILLIHLGMSGRLLVDRENGERGAHEHLRVTFEHGDVLHFIDPRRFGMIRLGRIEELDELAQLGPEPLDAKPGFLADLRRTQRAVKTALLDQRLVAGIGNIYANEILFRSGVRPTRRGTGLRKRDVERIEIMTREVLAEAVERRGTSFSDYFDLTGHRGTFQEVLSVFDRAGSPCPKCGSEIRRIIQAGRGSFYCPDCQC